MMHAIRKYGVSFTLIGLVFIFAMMYGFNGWMQEGRPSIRLVTVEGDATAVPIHELAVSGRYMYSQYGITEELVVTDKGAVLQPENTLLYSQLHDWYGGNKELRESNRSFFRGKHGGETIYSDEAMLAAVHYELFNREERFRFSVLNLNSNDRTDFTLPLPTEMSKLSGSWNAAGVQPTADGKLIVLATNNMNKGEHKVFRLLVNVERRTIEAIDSILQQESKQYDEISLRGNGYLQEKQRYFVFEAMKEVKQAAGQKEGDGTDQSNQAAEETATKESYAYYSYDIETGAVIQLPIEASLRYAGILRVSNGQLRFALTEGATISYYVFDMKSGRRVGQTLKVDASAWGAKRAQAWSSNEKSISILYNGGESQPGAAGVAVIDLQGGKVLYRGEIQGDGTDAEQERIRKHFQLDRGLQLTD